MDSLKTKRLSEDVERLIRETDEKFQAVGPILEGTSRRGFHTSKKIGSSRSRDLRIATRINFAHSNLTEAAPFTQLPTPKAPKQKKKKKRVADIISLGKVKDGSQPLRKISETALKDMSTNLSHVFSGKVFRLQVDELPSKTLPQNNSDNMRRPSIESSSSISTGGFTPTDPFHLEGFSCRIQATQQAFHLPPQPACPPPLPPSIYKTGQKAQIEQHPRREEKPVANSGSQLKLISETPMFPNAHTFLSTAPTKHRKHGSPPKALGLPTISETPFLRLFTDQGDRFITLQSTSFSWTSPLFRHGPIRIERTTREHHIFSPQDETLDWTAFQMAIQGTMDADGGDQRDDWEWKADERELDEIIVWWKDFGFEGFGSLEGPPPNSKIMEDGYKEVYLQPPSGSPGPKIGDLRYNAQLGLGSSTSSSEQGISAGWVGNSVPLASKSRSSLSESLPPSPMLELSASGHHCGDEDVRVPMGFNLGHDLGDFLNWETKHVQIFLD